ncbi:MAG: hypothetical protein OXF28_02865 [Thaumarchaeota archaeon]|nr:hypothetical protein [Nitrososphaerota archaeon]
MNKVIYFAILFTMIAGTITPVLAAQLDVRLNPDKNDAIVNMRYQRTIFIEYDEGGEIADFLRNKEFKTSFHADRNNNGVISLMNKLNQKLLDEGSVTRIKYLDVEYDAHLTGRNLNASIDYKINLIATIENFLMRSYSDNSPALVDISWRGLSAGDPVIINTQEFGEVEINMPISFISDNVSDVHDLLSKTDAMSLLSEPIINADGIKAQPLTNWHFLFDPTGINVDAATFGLADEISGFVVSSFTMGESSIREGRQVEKVFERIINLDKEYAVRSIESADSGNVFVVGFAAVDEVEGSEVFGVSPQSPDGYATTSTGGFPVMIIYGMAGIAGIGAVAILFFSNRQLKKEAGQGQQGIDPSLLKARSTSSEAGGYQTVRGEAYVADEGNQPTDEKKNNKGSMPKGWKP